MTAPRAPAGPRSRRSAAAALLAALAIGLIASPARAQETPVPEVSPTQTPVATPIPAADISSEADLAGKQLRAIAAAAAPVEEIDQIQDAVASAGVRIASMLPETRAQVEGGLSRSALEDLERQWMRENTTLDKWLTTLQRRAKELGQYLERTDEINQVWTMTRDSTEQQKLPTALRETVRSVLAGIEDARQSVTDRRDHVLTFQNEITGNKRVVEETLAGIRESIDARRKSLLLPEQPPMWRAAWAPQGPLSLGDRIRGRLRNSQAAIHDYLAAEFNRTLPHAIVLVVLCGVLISLRRRADAWASEDDTLAGTARLLSRPIAAAVLLATLMDEWFHPDAPLAWHDLLTVVLLVALLRLLPPLLPRWMLPGLFLLVMVFLIDHIAEYLPQEALLYRLMLLLLSAAAAGSLIWLDTRLGRLRQAGQSGWIRLTIRMCKLGAGLCVVALAANTIGAVTLAEVLTKGTLIGVFNAILVWAGAQVLKSAIAIVLRTATARRLNMVRFDAGRIRNATDTGIHLVAVVAWVSYALLGFRLLDPIRNTLVRAFQASITIGEWTFSPLAIVPVLVAIWLSIEFSKFVRFVLELDILPRVSLPRGVPATILKITHYVILVIGFVIVVSMIGVDLTKLTILAGALGVGIGFGLQNIVNNFVSGLILLFERPIKEGDKIEVGAISGQVQQIGMRASIVKTWQGAEVIVPNADLISKELTNWTLNDVLRRVEIPVGTAYGSDPEAVLNLLIQVASDSPDVLEDPAPAAIFVGFGDSSLNFELRAWTVEDFVRVRSELAVTLNRTLKNAGIEIPFPQRDVHIRNPATSGD